EAVIQAVIYRLNNQRSRSRAISASVWRHWVHERERVKKVRIGRPTWIGAPACGMSAKAGNCKGSICFWQIDFKVGIQGPSCGKTRRSLANRIALPTIPSFALEG